MFNLILSIMGTKKLVEIMVLIGAMITGLVAIIGSVIDGISKLEDDK